MSHAHYTVLGIDVKDYTGGDLKYQKHTQETLDRILVEAVNEHWLDKSTPEWIDAGDGGYMLFSGKLIPVLDILEHYQRQLDSANSKFTEDNKVYTRIAIHYDLVLPWKGGLGCKYTGDAINNCARLLSGMSREYNQQVVCTGAFMNAVDLFGNAAVESVRLRDIVDKHDNKHEVYNISKFPGFGATPKNIDRYPNPLKL